jgi:membrane-bound hydrogenase subunit beta
MTDTENIEKIKSLLGDKIVEFSNPSVRRLFVKVAPADLVSAVTILRDGLGLTFLSTITGLDVNENYELLYHFADDQLCLNIRVLIPKSDARVDSITPVIPGAILYEREIQDMFGISVERIPDPRPLLFHEEWPAGNYPLRKDWTYDRPEERIPGGKS